MSHLNEKNKTESSSVVESESESTIEKMILVPLIKRFTIKDWALVVTAAGCLFSFGIFFEKNINRENEDQLKGKLNDTLHTKARVEISHNKIENGDNSDSNINIIGNGNQVNH